MHRIALLMFVAILVACYRPNKTMVITQVKTSCATPPPKRTAEPISREMPADCPEGYACYTDEDDAKIARRLLAHEELERWAKITYTACEDTP